MRDALHALTGEVWAIDESWLPLLAALATRGDVKPEHQKVWTDREAFASAGAGSRRLGGARYATVTQDNVALLRIYGPIFPRANLMTEASGATSVSMLQADYQAALVSPDVDAVMLLIDSPGGAVSGVSALADRIWAGKKQKPTFAHVEGSMASAAYWLGCQASRVTADRTALIGSIGVAAAIPKQSGPDKDGKNWIEVVSSNAPDKRPDAASEDGLAKIRKMLDGVEAEFIADVARGRGTTATRVKSDFGRGGMEPARAAADVGMIDRVASFNDAYRDIVRDLKNDRRAAALRQ